MADDKVQIPIEVVLEDGSIKKAFLKLEKEINKNVNGAGEKIAEGLTEPSADSFKDLAKIASTRLAGIAGAAVAIGAAINKALDLTVAGERIKAVQAQFDFLAASANISASTLKDGLESAANGLVDVDSLLQRANGAIINLGSSADRLPEILNLAIKATKILGGEVEDRFGAIVSAVETGNTKILRSQGIILDADSALKKYAATLKLLPNELSQSQRQQAILNEVLEIGGRNFKKANDSVQPLSDGIKRAEVAFGSFIDNTKKSLSDTLGPAFAFVAEKIAAFFNAANEANKGRFGQNLLQQATAIRVSIIATEEKLKSLKQTLANTPNSLNELNTRISLNNQIKETAKFLEELQAKYKATGATNTNQTKEFLEEEKKKQAAIAETGSKAEKLTSDQLAAIQLRASQARSLQASLDQSVLQARFQDLVNLQETETQKLLIEQNVSDQIKNIRILQQSETLEKEKQLRDLGVTDEQAYAALRLSIAQKADEDIKNLEAAAAQRRKDEAKQLAASMKATLVSGLSSAFQEVGRRLQAGESLFEDFGASVVGIFGDMAIQLGTALVAKGLAVEAFIESINTLFPGSGLAAAAAGAGLIIFGSALKASVGKGGGGAGASVPSGGSDSFSGGGVTSSPGEISEISDTTTEPKPNIQVVVQGNILDRRSSSLEIVDLLQEAFDTQGARVTGLA